MRRSVAAHRRRRLFALTVPLFGSSGRHVACGSSSRWPAACCSRRCRDGARASCWPSRCSSSTLVAGEPLSWELALTLVALTAFMVGFAGNVRLNIELRETREQLAVAAVAAERERIGRDLHDILGHSLTAIAVKAGLARRLLASDAARRPEPRSATWSGWPGRRSRTSGPLRPAIERCRWRPSWASRPECCGRPGSGRTCRRRRTTWTRTRARLFGYVLREAVTNVVRHSGAGPAASSCTAQHRDRRRRQTVSTGIRPRATGSGLQNLADRIGAQGGSCEAGPGPDGGFVIRAGLPAAVPGRTGIGSATA